MTSNRNETVEVRRIQKVYAGRDSGPRKDRLNAGRRLMIEERDRLFERYLKSHLTVPLSECRVLDIGCGDGNQLAWLRDAGATPDHLVGIDVLSDKITRARQRHPDFEFHDANAEVLPFLDGSFDLLVVMTVFSSILDGGMADNVAAEMARVLKPGGLILWYDMRYPNPANRNVRPITRGQIQTLFPDFTPILETTTLIPQIARVLGRIAGVGLSRAYAALVVLPPLRSHLLGVLRAPSSAGVDRDF